MLDEELAEVRIEVVQRLPDGAVDLHAHRQLAAALADDVGQRRALEGRAHRLDGKRRVRRREELEGHEVARAAAVGLARDGVDPAQLVILRGILEGHGEVPALRQLLRLQLAPGHFGWCV